MKNIYVLLIMLFILFNIKSTFSQSDSVYKLDFDISVSKEFPLNLKPKIITGLKTSEMEDNTGISFLNDSTVSIFKNNKSRFVTDINKIENISVKDGNQLLKGIILGTVWGFVAGLMSGLTYLTVSDQDDLNKAIIGGILVPIVTISGVITGGIIGALSDGYDDYDLNKLSKKARNERLKKIINRYKK